jgi:deazaflavin-dependent oxidoreductase (nitroreductase family)
MTSLAEKGLYAFLRAHNAIYQGTNGWIGHRFPGAPDALLLHTVGAKTGQARTTSLSYARDGDDYLVVASKAGDPKAPGWYHNLKANPNVEINVGPKRFAVTAQPVVPGDPDYPRLWEVVNNMKNNKNRYIGYQKMTSRPIPVVRLTP